MRTVIIQPSIFSNSPFTTMLYRGAERHGYASSSDIHPFLHMSDAGRTLVVVYLPDVDANAHMHRQQSWAYGRALGETGRLWNHLARALPSDTAMVGTADTHGHCDIPPGGKMRLSRHLTEGLLCWGDGRVLMFNGSAEQARLLAVQTGSRYLDAPLLRQWLGGGPAHPELQDFPTSALLAPTDKLILPDYLGDGYLVGHHGGITPQELLIPLLVA